MIYHNDDFVRIGSMLLFVLLSACGTDSGQIIDDSHLGDKDSRAVSVAVSRSVIAVNDVICPNGGIQVNTGIDENFNGILDVDEVDKTENVCHGVDGRAALIKTSVEPAGSNCSLGGIFFESGTDLNSDFILDAVEVTNANYLCNVAATDSEPDNPISSGKLNYVKLLTSRFAELLTVGDSAEISIGLELELEGYDSDNPLFIKISDSKSYFSSSLHTVTASSEHFSLELNSRIFAEATSISTALNLEFCHDRSCAAKAYFDKQVVVEVNVEPKFNSAKLSSSTISEEIIIGQSNLISLGIDFDSEGYNYNYPLYVFVNDGNNSIQTNTFILRDVSEPVTLELSTISFYALGEINSTLSVKFCKDYYCSLPLQAASEIDVHLKVRDPIVFISPEVEQLSLAQTILEKNSVDYVVNLSSEDDMNSPFWLSVYDPSGVYFTDINIGYLSLSDSPITIPIEFYAIDGLKTEQNNFQIKLRACKDRNCETVLSPELGSTDVTLRVLYPSAALVINEDTISVQSKDGMPAVTELTGSWSVNNIGDLQAYAVATDNLDGTIVSSSMMLHGQGDFNISMELLPQRQLKSYSAEVSFKVCLEPTCEHEIGNSEKVLSVENDVNQLAGWTTHQRNAAHSGYIPITLDVNDFSESWTWGARPNAINPVVVQNGKVVITDEAYHEDASIFMLDEATGDQIWKIDLEAVPALNPPAISEGKVWAATTGHSDTYLHAFDFETGQKLHESKFNGQWPNYFAPTPYANSIYQGGGYYGGYVHSFSADDGQDEWEAGLSGAWDLYTPAVSGSYLLHYNGQDLHALHRVTGELEFTLGDTLNEYASHGYHGSPVVYKNFALAYAGGAFSGKASASAEHRDERHLVMFDTKNKLHLWNSAERYLTHPAVNDDVVYVGSDSRGMLDAIDVNSGEILWSWEPSDESETEMHRNVIVTDNLLFVSTNSKVHAIDLTTKKSVWNYPSPGMISISENKTLLIATGASVSDGKLIAIQLQ